MGCHCLLRQRLLAVLWRLNLCRRKRSSPTGDQAACCAGQVGAHRRDEFHPFVQDVAAGSHGGGVGRGGPGACGPRRPGSGSSLRAGRPQGFRGLSPSSCPGRTSWKSARPQRWLCRFHGALRNTAPPVPRPPSPVSPPIRGEMARPPEPPGPSGRGSPERSRGWRRRLHMDRVAGAPPPVGIILRNLGAHG